MAFEDDIHILPSGSNGNIGKRQHYYGDTVRVLFVIGALIIIATLPFYADALPIPTLFSILAVLALVFFAGFTSPVQKGVMIVNLFLSVGALLIFEYAAVLSYATFSSTDWLFLVNQLLALNFLLATYFSSKTLRGMYSKKSKK